MLHVSPFNRVTVSKCFIHSQIMNYPPDKNKTFNIQANNTRWFKNCHYVNSPIFVYRCELINTHHAICLKIVYVMNDSSNSNTPRSINIFAELSVVFKTQKYLWKKVWLLRGQLVISLQRCKENQICWVVIHLSNDYLDFYITELLI